MQENSTQDLIRVVSLLVEHKELFRKCYVQRVNQAMPEYSNEAELGLNISHIFDDFVSLIESHQVANIHDHLSEISLARIEQGISLSDYLRAIMLALTSIHDLVRDKGESGDKGLASGVAQLEILFHQFISIAARVYMDHVSADLEHKNHELFELNEKLRLHESYLQGEAVKTNRELGSATEFNRRVIDSLTAGLLVINSTTQKVTLYTRRMEEIMGLKPEHVLGKDIQQVLSRVEGLDAGKLISCVQKHGKLPLTKVWVRLPNGKRRSVHIQAQRMYDDQGVAEGTVVAVDDITVRELLFESFSKYVSQDLINQILATAEPLKLQGEKKICTIFFADIRGFTSLSEKLSAEKMHEILNAYFRIMIQCITKHGGFIDKFIGDKIMAIYNDNAEGDRAKKCGAKQAIKTALQLKKEIAALNVTRRTQGEQCIEVGVGINKGEVMLGNIGDESRMDFTAIGDVVNVADRFQALAKNGEVFVGKEIVAADTEKDYQFIDRGLKNLKGRLQAVQIYELQIN